MQLGPGDLRPAAVAGLFYPDVPTSLERAVDGHLAQGRRKLADVMTFVERGAPKAIVAPHAGYRYSGDVAGVAYASVVPRADVIRRVVLIGPAHRVAFEGIALPEGAGFDSPLGPVSFDRARIDELVELPYVQRSELAHREEHSLEVHVPFLQRVLGDFELTPLVVGHAKPGQVADLLRRVWGGPETLVVLSTDLSHFHDQDTATIVDEATAAGIVAGRSDLNRREACGAFGLNGLGEFGREHPLDLALLDRRTSGDTAGPRDRVVGYASIGIWEREA